jgi:hypothetical protein
MCKSENHKQLPRVCARCVIVPGMQSSIGAGMTSRGRVVAVPLIWRLYTRWGRQDGNVRFGPGGFPEWSLKIKAFDDEGRYQRGADTTPALRL